MFSLSSAFNHLSLFCFINNSICLDRLPFLVLSFNYLIIMVAASLFCIHLSFCRYQKRSWSGGELIFLMGLKCFSVNPLLSFEYFQYWTTNDLKLLGYALQIRINFLSVVNSVKINIHRSVNMFWWPTMVLLRPHRKHPGNLRKLRKNFRSK